MGSREPLGTPYPDYLDTQVSETIILHGLDKFVDHTLAAERKRKRDALMDEELSIFSSMTETVKEVASTIRESKPVNVHSSLYGTVMHTIGFNEALMLALSHRLENMAPSLGFVRM
ncbi:hypothetical protein CFC21_061416 [Triticum aestivum]|uniref:Uncharacterized protein n=2 Tax=Triticum aestivum TaxID=4565 RepID=A0A9R1KGW1_WHEAT|nr:hypothetical protein CFC21_061416 [Triticum aestivum]